MAKKSKNTKLTEEKGFNIDFFELAFLAEACIPPRPIARAYFWKNLTDRYWFQMTENQRTRMFEWISRNPFYEESLKKEEDTRIFHARFNPDNQYMVEVYFNGELQTHRAFLYENNYYLDSRKLINEDYIREVNKIKWEE